MKVLYVVSEMYPLIKTGGLGDVAYSLPIALQQEGAEVQILLPAYRDVLKQMDSLRIIGHLELQGAGHTHGARVLEMPHPVLPQPIWLLDCPALFDRPGNPYLNTEGYDWPDNAERFTCFSEAAAQISMGALNGWKADVVHCHDWQTGLVAAFLAQEQQPPRRVFTIHNIAYGGHFSHKQFVKLQLPATWWSPEGVEFHGGFSMLKAGMIYADAITTVSPSYAEEICTPAFGYGMEGVLAARHYKLSGILNGIDEQAWDPSTDSHLAACYTVQRRRPGKAKNKAALLAYFGAEASEAMLAAPLLGMVGRLVEQKGIDLILEAIPHLIIETDANFVLVGNGNRQFEFWLQELALQYPLRVFAHIGYSEHLAHLLEAGSDLFLMPSRFEPCGLNQMYSLRYGTLPIVNHTGGLADTVTDASEDNLKAGTATGFVMPEASLPALQQTILRALQCYRQQKPWQQMQRTAMSQDVSWRHSALEYLLLYKDSYTR